MSILNLNTHIFQPFQACYQKSRPSFFLFFRFFFLRFLVSHRPHFSGHDAAPSRCQKRATRRDEALVAAHVVGAFGRDAVAADGVGVKKHMDDVWGKAIVHF